MVPPHTLQQKPEVAFKPKQLTTTAAILTVREKKHKAHNRAATAAGHPGPGPACGLDSQTVGTTKAISVEPRLKPAMNE